MTTIGAVLATGAVGNDSDLAAAVLVNGRDPYPMFVADGLTATGARLRGPLLLEVGEIVALRLTRGAHTAEVTSTVVEVRGSDAELVVSFAAGDAGKLGPLLRR